MPDPAHTPPAGYLTMSKVIERFGVANGTVQRITRDSRLSAYHEPRDRRMRLVKVEDIVRLLPAE